MKPGQTLESIAKELDRQVKTKKDFIAPGKELEVVPEEAGQFGLKVNGFGTFRVTDVAHEQIGSRLGIPKAYYDRMRAEAPGLLASNTNHWLRSEPKQRMVRTLDGRARALLSNRYRSLENFDLAEAALPIIQDKGCKIVSAELTERRLYIKAVTDKVSIEVKKGDVVQAGIVISNSEIGCGGVRVEPMIYRLVCLNGMIAPDYALKKYHIGRGLAGDEDGAEELYQDSTRQADDKVFWMKVRDIVAGSLQKDVFERIAARVTESASEQMSGDPVKVIEMAQKKFGLSDSERGGVLKHLISGGDLSRWGMVNAITRVSQDVESYDRATDLERLGGQVLELPKTEWKSIAEAK